MTIDIINSDENPILIMWLLVQFCGATFDEHVSNSILSTPMKWQLFCFEFRVLIC